MCAQYGIPHCLHIKYFICKQCGIPYCAHIKGPVLL